MSLQTSSQKYILDFKFDAGTSRGVLKEKETFFIKIWDSKDEQVFGLGECGPLPKLSFDHRPDFEKHLQQVAYRLRGYDLPGSIDAAFDIATELSGKEFPSIRFGIETALLDLMNGGRRLIFDSAFAHGQQEIPINGLIWMNDVSQMVEQVADKISVGFDCIKMKIGAIDFEMECNVLQRIRNSDHGNVVLRVDANGAFKVEEALDKLHTLSQYNIHSIEQPIRQGQPLEMEKLCRKTPINIALDEELIGVYNRGDKEKLLTQIRPQYIILKPTLVGGLRSCIEWVGIAQSMGVGWWLTSALESNIGLNAICQLAAYIHAPGHQGLGTGQLYHNNITSPLCIEQGHIRYDKSTNWDFSSLVL